MKRFIIASIAAVAILSISQREANAQFPYYRGYGSYPSYGFQQSNAFVNPYFGYRSFNNSGFYATPYSTGFYQNYGVFQRPLYVGAFPSFYSAPVGFNYGYNYNYNFGYNYRYGGFNSSRYYFGW